MKYLSVCSGIEAATVAWHPLGWKPFAFAEIEKFPSAVLAHHYPHVPNLGDMTKFKEWPDAKIDLLVGGTPCQSFSVAGLRKGLEDPRGNLALTYCAILDKYRPRWFVWENVPGVLSSDGGRAFGSILGAMAELGYGWAYRVIDAQYVRVDGFGRAVPQRRRRVFVVGHLGDWKRSAAVLFEPESLQGHTAPRRQAGQGIAGTISSRPSGGGGLGTDFDCDGGLIAYVPDIVSQAMSSKWSKGASGPAGDEVANLIAHSLRAKFNAGEDGTGRGTPLVPIPFDTTQITSKTNRSNPMLSDPCHALAAGSHAPAVAFDLRGREGGSQPEGLHDTANIRAASGGSSRSYVAQEWAVRRLTPMECERLQGFPDNFSNVPYRGKPAADGPRYKALGNSMAVNVMRWIGYRIQMIEASAPQRLSLERFRADLALLPKLAALQARISSHKIV